MIKKYDIKFDEHPTELGCNCNIDIKENGRFVRFRDYEELKKALYKALDFVTENYINDDDFYNDWQKECDLASYQERWNA